MQFFYDGQIRRYLSQTIRVFSNFVVKYGDGSLVQIPVVYGDPDRQVASILRQNSENVVNSCPRIAIYISGLELDRDRSADSTFVGKMHIRERAVDTSVEPNQYTQGQGRNYTVERLMPTPFKLSMKVDIWASSTEQKLQILEQILVLFNPSLELQSSDNYIDWTSLSVLNLKSTNWTSKTVPVGTDTPIDIATLTVDAPIWISPPVKVKHLGVITKIITSLYDYHDTDENQYIDGLGHPLVGPDTGLSSIITPSIVTTVTGHGIQVYNNQAKLMKLTESVMPRNPTIEISIKQGPVIEWNEVFEDYPNKYVAGVSRLYLKQPNGSEVVGTIAINPLDPTILTIAWDQDTLLTNTGIDSEGRLDTDHDYNTGTNYRVRSPGTFDAIIDPQTVYPGYGMTNVVSGDRFLIVDDIGDVINQDGPDGWKNDNGTDFVAKANDIIEWQEDRWRIIFNANQEADTLIHQTNIYTGVQYMWNGISWVKSFEGEYRNGSWRIEL